MLGEGMICKQKGGASVWIPSFGFALWTLGSYPLISKCMPCVCVRVCMCVVVFPLCTASEGRCLLESSALMQREGLEG